MFTTQSNCTIDGCRCNFDFLPSQMGENLKRSGLKAQIQDDYCMSYL